MSAVEEERHSPGWRRPSEVMKKRKKKKKVRDSVSDISMTRSKSTSSSPQRPGIVLKRRNPFGCGGAVSARRRIASDVGTKDSYDEKVRRLDPDKLLFISLVLSVCLHFLSRHLFTFMS